MLSQSETVRVVRGEYTASNGDLYKVVGPNVYYVDNAFVETLLGSITDKSTPVSMADNGFDLVLVDGTANGYQIDLVTRAMTPIVDPAFYGADVVQYIDTFFVFNRPGTGEFYISGSLAVTFDPLDIARKTGGSDPISTIVVLLRQIWLLGTKTSEVWVNTGAPDFTFGALPGAFIEHGCAAKYSAAGFDTAVYWLAQDKQGNAFVVKAAGGAVKRISTHAIEQDLRRYPRLDDAIGFVYQQLGHAFYQQSFPEADKTWCVEIETEQWHERAWLDENGGLHRHRANCYAFAYGKEVVGDWQNGRLYSYDPDVFTDDGRPILRIRTFPHLIQDGKQAFYEYFTADMEVGSLGGTMIPEVPPVSPDLSPVDPPQVTLRWSDDRGATYGNGILQSLGSEGQYLTSVIWNNLGVARDRIFELSWSAPIRTALNGAFLNFERGEN